MATINGDEFDNILNDTPENDTINGGAGKDRITVTGGGDSVDGGHR
jgi:Ca2+-binding RTX toxin-like protein